jgi:Flp pilus assembly pilin Flp
VKAIVSFLQDDQGQDLIEYTLLMAFIALAAASIFLSAGGSVASIWNSGSFALGVAANAAGGSSGPPTT